MQCLNCNEPIKPGEAFCGNCGAPIQPVPPQNQPTSIQPPTAPNYPTPPSTQPLPPTIPLPPSPSQPPTAPPKQPQFFEAPPNVQNLPDYAAAPLVKKKGNTLPPLKFIGIILLLLIITVAGILVISLQHKSHTVLVQKKAQQNTGTKLATPCFMLSLVDTFNVTNKNDTCDSNLYNKSTFAKSTNVYKIVSTNSGSNDETFFNQQAKTAVDKEIAADYASYTITKEESSTFSGSTDYIAYFVDQKQDIAAVEAAVLHQTNHGENIFIITHAVNGSSTNLQSLEAGWQWKK